MQGYERVRALANSWLAAGIIVTVAAGVAWQSLRHKTLTTDEPVHYRYGAQILSGDARRFDDSKMPVSAFNAMACEVAAAWGDAPEAVKGEPGLLCHPTAARLPTVFFAALSGLVVFAWTKKLYGEAAALFSLALFAFDPNLLGHSRLVTTDTYVTGAILLASYTYWRFLEYGGYRRALWASLCLGASQLTKYTAVYLYPIFLLLFLVRVGQAAETGRPPGRRLAAYLGIFTLGSLLIINAGFLFEGTLTPLGEYDFRTGLLRGVQKAAGPLAALPLPLPRPFLEGLDWVKWNESATSFGNLYLLGELRYKGADLEGFPGYFFIVSFFKLPIATQLALAWALVGLFVRRRARPLGDELFLLIPIAFFALYFNFFFKAQIGIRFFLVALPFLFIFAGSTLRPPTGRRSQLVAGALVAYLLASGLSYHPHYLSYMNEFVWDRKQAYRYVADSNLDWGQNRWYLRRHVREHPDVVVRPRQPMAGRLIVPVNRLVGVYNHPRYRWLRENFEPVAHVAHSYLVFEVTPEALAHLALPEPASPDPTSPGSTEPSPDPDPGSR